MTDLAPDASRQTPGAQPTTTDSPSGRAAGPVQGVLLVAMSCLAVLGAVLLAPVLPTMQDAFASTPNVAVLVPLALVVPALMIGLISPFAGSIIDRLGRKRLLVGALIGYGIFGMAPLLLDSLPAIVATRAGVGIAEAAIMTCSTTLIVDYFDGPARNKWLGMQTVVAALGATAFFAIGGILGASGWRTPFWLYGSSFVFALLTVLFIWQPAKAAAEAHRELPPFPWRVLRIPVLVSVFGGIVFYTPIAELSYRLDAVGITSTGTIGAIGAAASLATASGGIAFARLGTVGTRTLLTVAFTLAGVGLLGFAFAEPLPLLIGSVLVASLGTGLLLPTLLTWAVAQLSFDERGRGTGLWTSAQFIGNFICPLLVLALTGLVGGLSGALALIGGLSLVMVLVSRSLVRDA